MEYEVDSLRQAAVFISSLDKDTATDVLNRMSAERAQLLRDVVQSIKNVTDSERDQIIQEVFRTAHMPGQTEYEGVELHGLVAQQIGTSELSPHGSQVAKSDNECLPTDNEVRLVAQFLAKEHSQTAAFFLARQPASFASRVLEHLPAEAQRTVLTRITQLDEVTDPTVEVTIQTQLQRWLDQHQPSQPDGSTGRQLASQILAATCDRSRGKLLSDLAKENPCLATELGYVAGDPTSANVEDDRITEVADQTEASQCPPPTHCASDHQTGVTKCLEYESNKRATWLEPDADDRLYSNEPPALCTEIEDVLRLSSDVLNEVVQNIPTETAILAFSAASQSAVEELLAQLPPDVANPFRSSLRCISGPIRLRDVDLAQQYMIQVANNALRWAVTNQS